MEIYVIGTEPVPEWCRPKLMPYKRPQGDIGYEFHGKTIDFMLQAGDELIHDGNQIHVRSKRHD